MNADPATPKNRKRITLLTAIFLTAFAVRFGLYSVYTPPLLYDAREYYINSQTLENTARHLPYDHWYERTPAYMLFLHLVRQNLVVQIFLSALTCVLLELLYRHSGWFYAFYLPGICYSNMYMKETLLVFFFVGAVYVFRKHRGWLVLVLPLLFASFLSYGAVWEYNKQHIRILDRVFTEHIWALWKPEWGYSDFVPEPAPWLSWLLRGLFFIYYTPVMFLFLRKIRIGDFELWIVLGLTVVAILSFGIARYREAAMPFIVGYAAPYLIQAANRARIHLAGLTLSSKKA